MTKCPVCDEGTLRKGAVEEEMFGVKLGKYDAEVCPKCGESFLSAESMRQIEAKAKELGLWGLSKNVKVSRTGNSLCVRIPAKIAQYLGIQEGRDVTLHPDGKNRIIVEVD